MLGDLKPDIMLESAEEVIVGELTSPMEHNMAAQHARKAQKYAHFKLPAGDNRAVHVMPFEVGARGGVTDSLKAFTKRIGLTTKQHAALRDKASKTAVRCSLAVFNNRKDKEWIPPQI